jgi:hypothetical protein
MTPILTTTLTILPILEGVATYYDPSTLSPVFRSGDYVTSAHGLEVAVDASEWNRLARDWIIACSPFSCGVFQIKDTGYLYGAGRFEACEHREGFCPVTPEQLNGQPIVLDFTLSAFRLISPNLETVSIRAWRCNPEEVF